MAVRTLALLGLLAMAAFAAPPARAQEPEDLVRWIYTSLQQPGPGPKGLAYITSAAQRERYLSRRMVDFFGANDSYGSDLMMACVDFSFDIPGQDRDADEVLRTLTVTSDGDTSRRRVTATFTNFGERAEITYEFIPEGGVWRLDDISGPDWRVLDIPCTPRRGAARRRGSAAPGIAT